MPEVWHVPQLLNWPCKQANKDTKFGISQPTNLPLAYIMLPALAVTARESVPKTDQSGSAITANAGPADPES